MGDAKYDLGNDLTIDAENPELHSLPKKCVECNVIYYFGGHFCTKDHEPSKAFKRGIQGYYDGE